MARKGRLIWHLGGDGEQRKKKKDGKKRNKKRRKKTRSSSKYYLAIRRRTANGVVALQAPGNVRHDGSGFFFLS